MLTSLFFYLGLTCGRGPVPRQYVPQSSGTVVRRTLDAAVPDPAVLVAPQVPPVTCSKRPKLCSKLSNQLHCRRSIIIEPIYEKVRCQCEHISLKIKQYSFKNIKLLSPVELHVTVSLSPVRSDFAPAGSL